MKFLGRFCGLAALACSFVVLSAPAWGAVVEKTARYQLGEVIVSGTDSGVENVATMETVDAATIKRRGARTLNEALNLVPGVNLRNGADGTTRIDIRGFRTRHVLLLLDGIPVNSTFDGQFDPSMIPVEHIAEIKVTTGGGSVLYGPGGNGGVINIITQKGTQGVHGTVAAEAGQEDSYLTKGSLSGATEQVDAFVSGSFYKRNGFALSDHFSETAAEDGDQRENSDRKNNNLFANMGYAPSENTLLGLTFNYVQGEYGKPPVTNYDKSDPFTKKPKYQRVEDYEGYSTQVAFEHATEGPLSLRGWVYFNQMNTEESRYDNAGYDAQVKKGAFDADTTTETTGVSVQVKMDLQSRGMATLGLIAQNEDWESDGFKMVKDNTPESFDEDQDLQIYTAALEYEVSPVDNLGVVLGYGQHFQKRDGGDGEDDFSYLIGAHYDLSQNTRLRVSHARKIRFPSIKQLYDIDAGNEDLEAERTMHYEAGIEQNLPAATLLSLAAFVIDAKDFIEKDQDDVNQNFEDYRFKGAEVAIENRYVNNLTVRASYSYLDSEDRSSSSQKDELQHRPQDRLTLEGTYCFPFGLTANATLLYVANQFFYDSDGKDPLEKQELDAYTIVNVKLAQSLIEDALELYIGADNLFDEDYEQSYGFPQAGRMVYGGVEYRF